MKYLNKNGYLLSYLNKFNRGRNWGEGFGGSELPQSSFKCRTNFEEKKVDLVDIQGKKNLDLPPEIVFSVTTLNLI